MAGNALPERPVRESTRKREAYFLEYADAMRKVTKMPLMVTGGFRSRAAMDAALASGALDVVGVARPLCVDTDASARILDGSSESMHSYELDIDPPQAGLAWFCWQILRLADGQDADLALDGKSAIKAYFEHETKMAEAMSRG